MVSGDGNQFIEVDTRVYHYARWTINPNLQEPDLKYLEWIRENNPQRARTVYYGFPGSYEGMVFAPVAHKITTQFAFKRWVEFTAGCDVGHVTSATTAGLWALEEDKLFKIAEYYHDNSKQR